MTGEQGAAVHHRPSRTGVEIGLVVSIVGMLLGLAFNAGIQYAHIASLDVRTTALETQYAEIDHAQTPIQVRLGHIETLLQVIQSQQTKLQHSVDTKDGKR
jgi:hypothetical protein